MTPEIPDIQPPAAPAEPHLPLPQFPPPQSPIAFWDYADLGVFISAAIPGLFAAVYAARGLSLLLKISKSFEALFAQLVWYIFIFGVLWLLLKVRYHRPFWRSLGWKLPFGSEVLCLIIGPLLAFIVGILGYFIHTPVIKLPLFDQMLADHATTVLFALFVVIIGPLCEELAFRGFLMPLLMRSLGMFAGIAISGMLFGALHASEYQGSWRHVLLISMVGVYLGWIRYNYQSTAASTIVHATFNLTQFAAFLSQPK